MRRSVTLSIVTVTLTFSLTPHLHAQISQDRFEVSHQLREAERRAVVASVMEFSDKEGDIFWPSYDQYRLEAKGFQRQRLAMVDKLSSEIIGMTDDFARDTVLSALKLEGGQQKAKSIFITRLRKTLADARFFRYYQLETKLDAIFVYGWTQKIPLAINAEEALQMK